jgi:hypothetical protein
MVQYFGIPFSEVIRIITKLMEIRKEVKVSIKRNFVNSELWNLEVE